MSLSQGSRAAAIGVTALFMFALLSAPAATATPLVPYCLGNNHPSDSLPPLVGPEVCEQLTDRVFPEAFAHAEYGPIIPATDFIGYFEFQDGLEYLTAQYPDLITVHEVAQSVGPFNVLTQTNDPLPIYIVELTNKNSPVPMEQRQELLFMLSIHGNEKGGREGGFRVLEDLAKGISMGGEPVQDGLGMPEPLARPGADGNVETYQDYLDFMRVFLLFPNADGWAHDEPEYFARPCFAGDDPIGNPAGAYPGLFCRYNGAGTDLNRQMPTIGWQFVNEAIGRQAMAEPEAQGYNNWLVENHTWDYAIDIHGMLNHQNFGAVMLPAGSFTPQEMARTLRLTETFKERLNSDPHFDQWVQLMALGETVGGTVTPFLDMTPACGGGGIPIPLLGDPCDGESPTQVVGSSTFVEYYTVWDAIGYTDSGFSGDFFAQTTGLNAPGYDIELAYNHITVDSLYAGPGALWNDYHVHMVREIVKSFMDAAALDVQVSYETAGTRTLYVETSYVATNLDDEETRPGGWATENPTDDHWEYSSENPFFARPAKYFEDIVPFVKDGDAPGVLIAASADGISANRLASFDNLVIAGSAINDFLSGSAGSNQLADGEFDADAMQAILDWVDQGGNLVLTDASLAFLDEAGITQDAVDVAFHYAGASNMDSTHPLTNGLVDSVRQTVEPVPLGFAVGNNLPNWFIDGAAFAAVGGDVAGTSLNGEGVNLGTIPYGSGSIQVLGAFLPDPTEEFYHPYGIDHYATTFSANQLLRNMLGWEQVFDAPPIVITEAGELVQTENEPVASGTPGSDGEVDTDNGSPGAGLVVVLAVLGALVVALRRRS